MRIISALCILVYYSAITSVNADDIFSRFKISDISIGASLSDTIKILDNMKPGGALRQYDRIVQFQLPSERMQSLQGGTIVEFESALPAGDSDRRRFVFGTELNGSKLFYMTRTIEFSSKNSPDRGVVHSELESLYGTPSLSYSEGPSRTKTYWIFDKSGNTRSLELSKLKNVSVQPDDHPARCVLGSWNASEPFYDSNRRSKINSDCKVVIEATVEGKGDQGLVNSIEYRITELSLFSGNQLFIDKKIDDSRKAYIEGFAPGPRPKL